MNHRVRLIRVGQAHHLTQGSIMGPVPEAIGWGYYYPL